MSDSRKLFYEAYWSPAGSPIPYDDPTTYERQCFLEQTLTYYLGRMEKGAARKILDAGCGRGEFSDFMEEIGFDVTGIDIASAAVKNTRARRPNRSVYAGSLEDRLPFCKAEFDAIWCTEVLEHLFDVHAALSEFNRVLHDNGILILTVPFHGLVKNIAIALTGFERHYNPYISHIRFFTKQSLNDSLKRAGFESLRWRGIGRMWPIYKSLFVVARKVRPSGPAPEIIG